MQHNNQSMGIRRMMVLGFWCLGIMAANAQSINQMQEIADLEFKHGKYRAALDHYQQVLAEKPDDTGIKYRIGVCFLETGQVKEAEKYLSFAASQKGTESKIWYHLGRLYHQDGQYRNAVGHYKKFLKTSEDKELRDWAKHYIRQCGYARELKYKDEKAVVNSMGQQVNGPLDDTAPVLSPGRENVIYFSSARPGNSGGLRDDDGLENEILGQYNEDIFSTELINGQWTAIRPMRDMINSSKTDQVLGFSDRGTVMYYYKGNISNVDGRIYTDTLRNHQEIIVPKEFKSPINLKEGDETPFFFMDSIIIYASRQEGGYGGLDLYITRRLTREFWTVPQNLGPTINSALDEKCPYLATDGRTLYFSSNRPESLGGFDIFHSVFLDDVAAWSVPENMAQPINSPSDDLYFCPAKDGLRAFLASNRVDGMGGFDLYVAYFKSTQREQLSRSNPVCFHLVKPSGGQPIGSPGIPQGGNPSDPASITVNDLMLSPMFYNDDDILNNSNKSQLNRIARFLKTNPGYRVELSGHTDDANPEKFRLYFSYLHAEKAGGYLKDSGIPANRILSRGLGDAYPVSQNTSPNGRKMNRRIEIRIIQPDATDAGAELKWPIINDRIKVNNRQRYDDHLVGLSYKVQVAALHNMYDSDIILEFDDAMLERDDVNGLLKYTVGLTRSYSSARFLQEKLITKGVGSPFIVPYVNGIRLDKQSALEWADKYPDLRMYVNGK